MLIDRVKVDKLGEGEGKYTLFIRQFAKYFVVGGFAAILDIGTFTVLTAVFGVWHILANTVAITLGLIVNYALSSRWVFQQEKINVKRDFLPFAVIGIIGLGIQNLLLYILLDWHLAAAVNFAGFDTKTVLFLSKIFVTGVTFLWNFLARKYFIFDRNQPA